jgi:O-acetyl-ADP-ribose deacetylase (regulator of RNase III)
MATSTSSSFPVLQLLCMHDRFSDAFNAAAKKYGLPPSVSVTIHNYALSQLPSDIKFDTVVSPANSYGRLDGAFDDGISRALSPKDEYLALTNVVQRTLYQQWRGYAPSGTCTLVRIPDEFEARSRNVWGAKRVAICPTMRMPDDVRWDRELVYKCIWSLLCAVDNHNRSLREDECKNPDDTAIKSILMTPLATGVGAVSAETWAAQTVLAMKHFIEASEMPEKWSSLGWTEISLAGMDIEKTWQAI